MLLYRCPSYVTEAYDGPCYMGDLGDTCHDVVAAWGTGGSVREGPPPTGSVGGIVILSAVFPLIRRSDFRTTWVFPPEERAGTCFIGWKSTTIIKMMKQVSAAIMDYDLLRSMSVRIRCSPVCSSEFWSRSCSVQAGRIAQDWGSTTDPPGLGSTTWESWPQGLG